MFVSKYYLHVIIYLKKNYTSHFWVALIACNFQSQKKAVKPTLLLFLLSPPADTWLSKLSSSPVSTDLRLKAVTQMVLCGAGLCVCMHLHALTPFLLRILCTQIPSTGHLWVQSQRPQFAQMDVWFWELSKLVNFQSLVFKLWKFTGKWSNG